MIRAIHSEFVKIRTTKTWWLFAIGIFLTTALALLIFTLAASFESSQAGSISKGLAIQLYTAGQYFGVMFVMLFAALMITNEYRHETATTTFLATPSRLTVVLSKLVVGALAAAGFWLFTTVLDLSVGVIFFSAQSHDNYLGEWAVWQAILLNLLAYTLWAALGVGFGALLRNQVGTVVTGLVLYLIGYVPALAVIVAISRALDATWLFTAAVALPPVASQIMTTPGLAYPEAAPQYVGLLVMIGYAVISGTIGILIMQRRDVS